MRDLLLLTLCLGQLQQIKKWGGRRDSKSETPRVYSMKYWWYAMNSLVCYIHKCYHVIMLSKSSRLHRLKMNKYFIISRSLLITVLSVDQDIMVSTHTNLMVMLLVLIRYSPSSPIVSEPNLSYVNIAQQVLSFDFNWYYHFFNNIAFLFQQLASHTANSVWRAFSFRRFCLRHLSLIVSAFTNYIIAR